MRFADLNTYVTAELTALGVYGDPDTDPTFPVINPGPPTVPELAKLATDRIIFLSLGSGPGLTSELLFDRIFITARVIGRQDDYTDAETLAWDLDGMFTKIDSNAIVGTARVLYVTRTGGAPVLLEKDSASRYHFTCTYLTETESGL